MPDNVAMVVYLDRSGEVLRVTDAEGTELREGQLSRESPIEGRLGEEKYFSLLSFDMGDNETLFYHASTCKWWCLHLPKKTIAQ